MRSRFSMIIRFGGLLLVIVGLLFLRDMYLRVDDVLENASILTILNSDQKSGTVAGVATSDDQSVTQREITVITSRNIYDLTVEEARTVEERMRGLMYRDSLCDSCGMLFFNKTDTNEGFWMKNCEIPLDIVFINSNKEIVDMKLDFQPCTTEPCPVYHPSVSYRYTLEVNAGWIEEHGVTVGDTISF